MCSLLDLVMKEARMMVSHRREFKMTAELMDPGKNVTLEEVRAKGKQRKVSPKDASKWSDKLQQHHLGQWKPRTTQALQSPSTLKMMLMMNPTLMKMMMMIRHPVKMDNLCRGSLERQAPKEEVETTVKEQEKEESSEPHLPT